jgi:hypothetical protein
MLTHGKYAEMDFSGMLREMVRAFALAGLTYLLDVFLPPIIT